MADGTIQKLRLEAQLNPGEVSQEERPQYLKLFCRYLISNFAYLFLVLLTAIASDHIFSLTVKDLVQIWDQLNHNSVPVTLSSGLVVFMALLYFLSRPRKVYLVNFACYKPAPHLMCPTNTLMQLSVLTKCFTEESLAFQKKVLERSGLGQKSYVPEALLQIPPNPCLSEGRKEAEMLTFGAIDELLEKTGVKPKDIGILVLNCSLLNPTPSLSAMIINHYKLSENIKSYNLSGMGCSAGLISIDLARSLLQLHRNSYALVVSTENGTFGWYFGNDRSMLIPNCLFRVGGAAILLSNHSCDRKRSKYELMHCVRTHKGADDRSYGCVTKREDDDKKTGISLSRDLTAVADQAMKSNLITLGRLVLPASEKLLFLANWIAIRVLRMKIKTYVPDFKLAFEHFCIHPGGKAVINIVQKSLDLSDWQIEPSSMTLYRFGNTSSCALWYELAYSEAKGRIKKNDRIWEIAFGSGFKCNSAVWRALRTINPAKEKNPWMDEIDQFPVQVPEVA